MPFQIDDNFHTNFTKQYFDVGTVNAFSAKVFAPREIHVMEFDFGVPEVGKAHDSQVMLEIWLNRDLSVEKTVIRQDRKIIDENSILPLAFKSKCQASDAEENCVTVLVSTLFLESPLYDVMALKAIDFSGRFQITYLNEGFDITGDPLNPPETDYMPSGKAGLVQMVRFDKFENLWFVPDYINPDEFDNLWVSPSGIIYTRNDVGSWFRLSPHIIEENDPSWNVMTRIHDEFYKMVEYEKKV